jgi:nuclear transport factor 2 (NTF2) superfamily protein
MTLEKLAKRVEVLEDIEAIKKLKARYAQACDNKYNPEEMGMIFTEDAVWDGGEEFGVYRGRKEIKEFFKKVSSDLIFAVHYFMAPSITIEGNKAHGRWYLWQAATLKGNRAVWLAGLEDDQYEKINNCWLQKEMRLKLLFLTPYEEGWHKKKIID